MSGSELEGTKGIRGNSPKVITVAIGSMLLAVGAAYLILGWFVLVPAQVPELVMGQQTRERLSMLYQGYYQYMHTYGRVPHLGTSTEYDSEHVVAAECMLGLDPAENVLFSNRPKPKPGWEWLGEDPQEYQQKWRGPYAYDDPRTVCFDAWGGRIRLLVASGTLRFWSAGHDQRFDHPGVVTTGGYTGDDILSDPLPLVGTGFGVDAVSPAFDQGLDGEVVVGPAPVVILGSSTSP